MEVDDKETLDKVMTFYSVIALGFEADWKLDEMAMLRRKDQVLAEAICRLEQKHKPPRSWSKEEPKQVRLGNTDWCSCS